MNFVDFLVQLNVFRSIFPLRNREDNNKVKKMVVLGKWIFTIGIVFVIVGLIIMYNNHIPFLGKLPGDIYIEKKNFHFYFPITTSLVISLILSILFYIIRKR